jgi:hypothetical protein
MPSANVLQLVKAWKNERLGFEVRPVVDCVMDRQTVLLGGLILANVRPSTWLASAVAPFIHEAIGLARAGDSLPPLTFVIRRYVPRWVVDASVFGFGAFAAMTWWSPPHRTAVIVAIPATVGWLINHFDVAVRRAGRVIPAEGLGAD